MSDRKPMLMVVGVILSAMVAVGCQQRTVFVTDSTHAGDLGGVAGADAICQAEADAAGLPGTYLAWISDAGTSPAARFNHTPEAAYVLVDGTLVALGWADLTDEMLVHSINLSALGTEHAQVGSWTNTRPDGTSLDTGDHDCQGWTSALPADFGVVGLSGECGPDWTMHIAMFCDFEAIHLYCFGQEANN